MKNIVMMIAILVLPGIAFSQSYLQSYIEVQGKAQVKIVPDQIYLRIQISEKQKNTTNLQAKEREMLSRLKDIGIDVAKDLVVKDMASNFSAKLFTDDNIVISKMYSLLVHDAKTANKVISEMEKLEISNIRVDRLDHTKMLDFKKECSIKAMEAAKVKAETLTHAIGQNIGRALYIEELPVVQQLPNELQNYRYKAEQATSSDWFVTDLDFDEITIDYTVLTRFELK